MNWFSPVISTTCLASDEFEQMLTATCFTWQEHILQFNVLNCLEFKSLSPLYECLILKVSSSVQNWPSLTCSVLKLRQCKQHCVRALRLQKVGVWNDNLSLLIRWGRHKRIDQAVTPNLFPGQRTLVPACHRSSHTDKTHALWMTWRSNVWIVTLAEQQMQYFTLCGHCTTKCS